MPTYEYRCKECSHEFETYQSFSDVPLVDCPKCKMLELERIISGGLGSFMSKDPTTIGQQAERNTKKMGRYELEEKRLAHKNDEKAAHQRVKDEAGIKEHTPFWGKPTKDLTNLTEAQKMKYIMEGK